MRFAKYYTTSTNLTWLWIYDIQIETNNLILLLNFGISLCFIHNWAYPMFFCKQLPYLELKIIIISCSLRFP